MVPATACLSRNQVLHGRRRDLLVGDRGRASSPASPGDCLLLPHGKPFVIASDLGLPAVDARKIVSSNSAVPGRASGDAGGGFSSAWNPLRSRGWCGLSPGCFASTRPPYRGSAMRLDAVGSAAASERDARTAGRRNAGRAAGSVYVAHRRVASTSGAEQLMVRGGSPLLPNHRSEQRSRVCTNGPLTRGRSKSWHVSQGCLGQRSPKTSRELLEKRPLPTSLAGE